MVLFGSVAEGFGGLDSDVDLLVIVDCVMDDVREIVAEAVFEASIGSCEPIEYIVMSLGSIG